MSNKKLTATPATAGGSTSEMALLTMLSGIGTPTFSGLPQEDVERFLLKANNWLVRMGIPEDKQHLYMSEWLKGIAEDWLYTLDKAARGDIDKLANAMRERFANSGDRMMKKTELANRQQARAESVSVYADAVRKLADRVGNVSDIDKCDFFVQGLRRELRLDVLRARPTSLQEAIECALRLESSLRIEDMIGGTSSISAVANVQEEALLRISEQLTKLNNRVGELEWKLRTAQGRARPTNANPSEEQRPTPTRPSTNADAIRAALRDNQVESVSGIPICGTCLKLGHTTAEHTNIPARWHGKN